MANVLLVEVLAAAWYAFENRQLVWLRQSPLDRVKQGDRTTAIPRPVGDAGMMLSPYFGYVNRGRSSEDSTSVTPSGIGAVPEPQLQHDCNTAPDIAACKSFLDLHGIHWSPRVFPQWKINNYGLQSAYDYPVAVPENAFVVGIFGGSVAFHYAFWASDRRSGVLKDLEKALGRPVIVLNFAIGGGKQPQQLHQLAHMVNLGQKFDLVLNIDGFNEIYVAWTNLMRDGMDSTMPSARILNTIASRYLDSQRSEAMAELATVEASRAQFASLRDRTRFAIVHYWSRTMLERRQRQLHQIEERWSSEARKSNFPLSTVRASGSFDEALPTIADQWYRSSISMGALAKAHGARYLHVLQPNQYVSSRSFSDDELGRHGVLAEGDAPLRTIVPAGYRTFLDRAGRFGAEGVNFVSSVRIFDRATGSIYFDWCCHFNERGNRILDLLIQRAILHMVDARAHRQRIRDIEGMLIRESGLDMIQLLKLSPPGTPDHAEADERKLAQVDGLIDSARRKLGAGDGSTAFNDTSSSLEYLSPLYTRDPKSTAVLRRYARVYQLQAEIASGTRDDARERVALQSLGAVYGQLKLLEPGNSGHDARLSEISHRLQAIAGRPQQR